MAQVPLWLKDAIIKLQKQKQVKNREKRDVKDAMLSSQAWALPCRVAKHLLSGGG